MFFMAASPGKCFVDLSEEIKDVYAVYCRNHDDAISLMEKVTLIYDNYANRSYERSILTRFSKHGKVTIRPIYVKCNQG